LAVVVAYVIAIAFVSFKAIRYELYLDGMRETSPLPPLAEWAFQIHHLTPWFLLASIPAIQCTISDRLSARQRRVAMLISIVGLLLLAMWFGLIWLGMGHLVMTFEEMVP
jgi:hypothetical protein